LEKKESFFRSFYFKRFGKKSFIFRIKGLQLKIINLLKIRFKQSYHFLNEENRNFLEIIQSKFFAFDKKRVGKIQQKYLVDKKDRKKKKNY